MIIENKPGAAGVIGTDLVAKAAPDGHTLLMVAGSLTVLAATSPKLPYDTERDLVPIAQLFGYPFVFVLNAGVPAKTLPEFIALTKQNPDKYNYSTTGQASHNHLVTERLKLLSGMQIQHLPYRGGAPRCWQSSGAKRISWLFRRRLRSPIFSPEPFVRSRSAGSLATSNTPTCRPSPSRGSRASRRCPRWPVRPARHSASDRRAIECRGE